MLYLSNKYTHWYYNIINHARNRQLAGYKEKHHIVPKSLGGPNTKDNLVDLTAREHFICHRLLVKMTTGDARRKMLYAAWRMCTTDKYGINSRVYEQIRTNHSKSLSEVKTGVKRGPFPAEYKEFRRNFMLGRKMTISEAGLEGKRKGAEKRKGREPWNKGKSNPYSEETLNKMSANFSRRLKGVPKVKKPCPQCGQVVSPHILARDHNPCSKPTL
jgi:hypothetical protein